MKSHTRTLAHFVGTPASRVEAATRYIQAYKAGVTDTHLSADEARDRYMRVLEHGILEFVEPEGSA